MIVRALLASAALALASSSARADACPTSRVDVADWALVRSARVPGFTLRLPRTFTRDTTPIANDSTPSARWRDAARGRFTMWHRAANATPPSLATSGDRPIATRCEARVGAATATIVAFDEGGGAYVVRAHIRWPDGEVLDVHAEADREHLEQLMTAVTTIRRAGA